MTFVQWVEYHTRSILFVALALAVAGAFAATSLPVGLFPQVAFPRVQVSARFQATARPTRWLRWSRAGGRGRCRVIPGVQEVAVRLEPRLGANLDRLRLGRDMTAATLQVDTALSHIMSSLPPGTKSVTRRMEPTVFPIIAYGLTSDKLSSQRVTDDLPNIIVSAPTCRSRLCQTLPLPAQACRSRRSCPICELWFQTGLREYRGSSPSAGKLLSCG